ncbi:MAG: hypothetical protein V7655_09240, partial [Aequorivita antarctica]
LLICVYCLGEGAVWFNPFRLPTEGSVATSSLKAMKHKAPSPVLMFFLLICVYCLGEGAVWFNPFRLPTEGSGATSSLKAMKHKAPSPVGLIFHLMGVFCMGEGAVWVTPSVSRLKGREPPYLFDGWIVGFLDCWIGSRYASTGSVQANLKSLPLIQIHSN